MSMKSDLAVVIAALAAMYQESKQKKRHRSTMMGAKNTLPVFKTRPGWRDEQRKTRFKKIEARRRHNRRISV